MPISDAQFIAWLSQEHANRVVLYEQNYAYETELGVPGEGILYFSDRPYTRNTAFAALPYVECIASVPEFTRSLTGNRLNSYSSSIGAVELHNNDGELDYLLDLALDGSYARFFYGDASWPREDFRVMFEVFVACVRRAPFRRLSISLRDSSSFLNRSIGGVALVGGSGPYANNARPVNFGFVHNVTPLSYDSINLIYRHSDNTVGEAIAVEVRDDGVPVSFTENGDGTFTLASPPVGLITCDVESYPLADTSGSNANVSDTFDHVIQGRGGFDGFGLYAGPHPTFVIDDVDDYPLGVHIPEARNILELLAEITDSGNCFAAIRRDAYFTYGRLKPYDIESFGLEPVDLVEDDIVPPSAFEVEHDEPTYYQYQAYAHKNWTVQNNLSDVLNPDEKARFERKGQYALQSLVGGTTYILAPELYHKTLTVSPPIETLLSWDDDSSILYLTQWMETRRAMALPWIEHVTVTVPLGANPDAPAMFYALELGDVVRVTVPRFGYDVGTLFQVTSINIALSKNRVTLRLVRKRGATAPPIGWESSQQYIIASVLSYRRGLPTIEVGPTSPPIGPPGAGIGGGGGALISFGGISGSGGEEPPEEESEDIYYFDRFTSDGSTDQLTAHIPDVGAAYASDVDYTGAATLVCLGANTQINGEPVRNVENPGTGAFMYGIAPLGETVANCFIETRLHWDHGIEGFNETNFRLFGRKTADTLYQLEIDIAGGSSGEDYAAMTLKRVVSGSVTGTLATDADLYFPRTSNHIVRFEMEDNDLRAYVNGVLVFDVDDTGSTILDGEECGFGLAHNGIHIPGLFLDWVICGGLIAPPEYESFSPEAPTYNPLTPSLMRLGPDVSGFREIKYPASGTVTLMLYLVNHRPGKTYSLNSGDLPASSFSSLTVTAPAVGAPFVTGTIDCDTNHPLGATFYVEVIDDDTLAVLVHIDVIPE
jgi:hypothetical protein